MAMASSEVSNEIVVVALTVVASAILVKLLALLRSVLWEPLKFQRILGRQGVRGPLFRFIEGNLREATAYAQSFPEAMPLDDNYFGDFAPTVTPQYALYFPKYGMYSALCNSYIAAATIVQGVG